MKTLNDDQIAAAKKRIKALEKRDDEKKLTDEAKNSFESLIYEFRAFLQDDDCEAFVSDEDRMELVKKTGDFEDWLYDDGSDVGYKVYQEKHYDLLADYSKIKNRKEQYKEREENVPKYLELLQDTKTKGIEVRENMPWVTEQEQTDLLEKTDETREWLDGKIEEQSKLTPMDDPAFTIAEIETRMKKVTQLAKKVFHKKKPIEKKKKKEEKEEKDEEEQEDAKKGDDDNINLDDESFDKKEDSEQEQGEHKEEL